MTDDLIPQIDVEDTLMKTNLAVRVLAELPLAEFLRLVEAAHTLGPLLEPTAYRDMLRRNGSADDLARVVGMLLPAVEEWRRVMESADLPVPARWSAAT